MERQTIIKRQARKKRDGDRKTKRPTQEGKELRTERRGEKDERTEKCRKRQRQMRTEREKDKETS